MFLERGADVGINFLRLSFRSSTCSFGISLRRLIVRDPLSRKLTVDLLETMIDLADEELESRLLQHLLSSPIGDGGQFDMVIVFSFAPQS